MMIDNEISAIPLWIDGHAWFTVFERFIDVREADGAVNYRVPVCGRDEIDRALQSARDAQPAWCEDVAGREHLLAALAGLLDQFTGDFTKLVVRETGKTPEAARAEVESAVATLRGASCASGGCSVQAVFADAATPLASTAEGLVRAFTAGDTAIVMSAAAAPSAVFALAEISARVEFPAGALCLLHGDAATRAALETALQA